MELLKKNESYQKVVQYSDLKFDINGCLIPVNKSLLSLKSDYFDKLFSYNQREIIKLDFELNAFIHVISFIYSGKIDDMSTLIECIAILNELMIDKKKHIEKYILSCNDLNEVAEINLYLDSYYSNYPIEEKLDSLIKKDGLSDNIDFLFPLMKIERLIKLINFNQIRKRHIKYFLRSRIMTYNHFVIYIFSHWIKHLNQYNLLEVLLKQMDNIDKLVKIEIISIDDVQYLKFNLFEYKNPAFNHSGYYLQLPIQKKNLYYIKDDIVTECDKLKTYDNPRVYHKVYQVKFNGEMIEGDDLLNLYYLYSTL